MRSSRVFLNMTRKFSVGRRESLLVFFAGVILESDGLALVSLPRRLRLNALQKKRKGRKTAERYTVSWHTECADENECGKQNEGDARRDFGQRGEDEDCPETQKKARTEHSK